MKATSDLLKSRGDESGPVFPLTGILAVSIEQAVAAPYTTSRLAEAGARVIKIEKPPDGDFARSYDSVVHGESAHFVWLNQGKESAALDFNIPADMQILQSILNRRSQPSAGCRGIRRPSTDSI